MSFTMKQTPEGVNSYHKYSRLVQANVFNYLISKINIQKSWKILDLGCGPGNNTIKLAEMVGPDGNVIGVDPIKERIEFASKKYKYQNLEFHVGYGREISRFGEDFDLVITSAVLHWIPYEEKLLTFQEIMKCLKPNGYFLFAVPPKNHDCNFMKLLPMIPDKISKAVSDPIYYEDKGDYEKMLQDSGFEEVLTEERYQEDPFDSLEHGFEWFASTIHVVSYEESLQCLKDASMNNNIDFLYNKHGKVAVNRQILYGKCRRKTT